MAGTQFSNPNFSLTGLKELRNRLLFVFLSLVVYRIGIHILVPGLNPERSSMLFNQLNSGLLAHFNMVSGGALSYFTLFAIGLSPYITVSIIVQMLSTIVPSLEKLSKEGEAGRRKLNQYTRYGTAVLALIYSVSYTLFFIKQDFVLEPGFRFYSVAVITLMAGPLLLMWLGEQITERGVGNGVSLIIFAGIISKLPVSIIQFIEQVRQNQINNLTALISIFIVFSIIAFIVFVESAQRKIMINYPQRQPQRGMYASQTSHLPLKINMAGIMPTIFASTFMVLPGFLLERFKLFERFSFLEKLSATISPGKPLYILLFALVITFFCFFYTAITFNPRETSETLKKSGGFISGIRPGEQSAQYIDKVMTRLTTIGCIYLLLVVLLPDFMRLSGKVPFEFGGTSLLITIVVAMEFITQMQSLLMSHQYEALLKKAKFKNLSSGLK